MMTIDLHQYISKTEQKISSSVLAQLDGQLHKYDPNQLRDSKGRWTSNGDDTHTYDGTTVTYSPTSRNVRTASSGTVKQAFAVFNVKHENIGTIYQFNDGRWQCQFERESLQRFNTGQRDFGTKEQALDSLIHNENLGAKRDEEDAENLKLYGSTFFTNEDRTKWNANPPNQGGGIKAALQDGIDQDKWSFKGNNMFGSGSSNGELTGLWFHHGPTAEKMEQWQHDYATYLVNRYGEPSDRELYRGIGLSEEQWQSSGLKEGAKIEMPATSFDGSEGASEYSEGTWKNKDELPDVSVVVHAPEGSRMLDVTSQSYWGEPEQVVAGNFVVDKVVTSENQAKPRWSGMYFTQGGTNTRHDVYLRLA
jgi:hypothetical protein